MRSSIVLAALVAGAAMTGALAAPSAAAASNCVTLLQGGDIGETYCIHPDDTSCLVEHREVTFTGTTVTCTGLGPHERSSTSACPVNMVGPDIQYRLCVTTNPSCVIYTSKRVGESYTTSCTGLP